MFEPLPDEMLSIKEHGTRTSVCVDDQYKFDDLPEYARAVAAAQTVPVYLTTRGFGRNCDRQRIDGRGGRGCSCKDAMRIRTDDFEFVGCFRCGDLPNRKRHAVYLIGIPIECYKYLEWDFLFATTTLDVLDERKYDPVTSRERLSDSAALRLMHAVDEAVQAEVARIECEPADVVRGAPQIVRDLARAGDVVLYEKDEERESVNMLDVVSESVRSAVRLLRMRYPVLARTDPDWFNGGETPRAKFAVGGGVADYDEPNLITMHTLDWISQRAGEAGQVWYARGQSIKWRRAAWNYVEDGKGPVIFLGDGDGEGWEELERMGVRPISAASGTIASAGGTMPDRAKVRYGTLVKSVRIEELDGDDVCVPRDPGLTKVLKVCVSMRKQGCHVARIGLFPWQGGAAESKAQTFDHMRAVVDVRTYETTAGPMTGREILDLPPDRLAICPADDKYVRAVCMNGVAAGAVDKGVTAVYRTYDADDDRLWLAYGYEHGGDVPEEVDNERLFRSAMTVLGVPEKAAAVLKRYSNAPMLVGHLRMLRTDAQRIMYLRLHDMIRAGYEDNDTAVAGAEQAAAYLSVTDPERGDLGLCMDIVRDMNGSGMCGFHDDDMYFYDVGASWRNALMALAVNRLAREATGRGLLRFDWSRLKADRVFDSAGGADKLMRGLLRHLFRRDTTVRTAVEGDRIVVDAAIGRGGRIGGALFTMLFGSAAQLEIGCAGDGRLRVAGCIGVLAGRRNRREGGHDASRADLDGCCC